jgi:MFS family permease
MRSVFKNVFYGWWIVAAGSAIGALNSGLYYYGFGAFFNPLLTEFGWSRAEVSGAFSIAQAEAGLVAPLAGIIIDRFGPKRIVTIGIGLVGIGYFLLPLTNGLMVFYAIFVLISIGASLGTTSLPFMAAISQWFVKRRGTAAGVLMAGFGAGGGLGTFFLGWMITNYHWRLAAIAVGIIFWTVGFPASRLLRGHPEEMGCYPDGDSPKPATSTSQTGPGARTSTPTETMITPRQALASSAFWLLTAIFAFRNVASTAVAVHQVPFFMDRSYELEDATALLAYTIWVSIAGRLFFGWLGDRWDRRWVLVLCNILMGTGTFIMTTIPDRNAAPEMQSLLLIACFILVFGPAYGGAWPVSIAMVADYFGRRYYATIQGMCSGIGVIGAALGPVLAGYLFDVSHSYIFALQGFALLTFLSIPLFFLVRRPRPPVSLAPRGEG